MPGTGSLARAALQNAAGESGVQDLPEKLLIQNAGTEAGRFKMPALSHYSTQNTLFSRRAGAAGSGFAG